MARHKDSKWALNDPVETWGEVNVAVLMDIRDELKELNRIIGCSNFIAIPGIMRAIQNNTTKVKRKTVK